MADPSDTTQYAREVYAACATVGYNSPGVTRLKAMLDADRGGSASELFEIAWQVQRAAVEWANSPTWPDRGAQGTTG